MRSMRRSPLRYQSVSRLRAVVYSQPRKPCSSPSKVGQGLEQPHPDVGGEVLGGRCRLDAQVAQQAGLELAPQTGERLLVPALCRLHSPPEVQHACHLPSRTTRSETRSPVMFIHPVTPGVQHTDPSSRAQPRRIPRCNGNRRSIVYRRRAEDRAQPLSRPNRRARSATPGPVGCRSGSGPTPSRYASPAGDGCRGEPTRGRTGDTPMLRTRTGGPGPGGRPAGRRGGPRRRGRRHGRLRASPDPRRRPRPASSSSPATGWPASTGHRRPGRRR